MTSWATRRGALGLCSRRGLGTARYRGPRVALTYNSAISYELPTTETSVLGTVNSTTDTETPQSVNFEFQTGVAADTLLFGGVRWVDWTAVRGEPAQPTPR